MDTPSPHGGWGRWVHFCSLPSLEHMMRHVMVACDARPRKVRRPSQWLGRGWVVMEYVRKDAIVQMLCCRWVGYFVCQWSPAGLVVPAWVHGFNIDEVKMLKKVQPLPEATVVSAQANPDSKVLAKFPILRQHLTVRVYEGGEARQTSLLMVSVIGSMWRVTLKDRDSCTQLPVLGATVDEALAAMEVALSSDKTPWEPDAWAADRQPKKKSKK